jgi:hypothetical protein
MPWVRDLNASLRENICAHIADRLASIQAGVGQYTHTFNLVTRAPITKPEATVDVSVAVLDPRESKSREVGYQRCVMTLVTEFYIRLKLGDVPRTEINVVMLDIYRSIMADQTCSGLTISITETGNEVDVDGPSDGLVSGVLVWEILYRHQINDPRKKVGE